MVKPIDKHKTHVIVVIVRIRLAAGILILNLDKREGVKSMQAFTFTWYLYSGAELVEYGWCRSLDEARLTARSVALSEGGDRIVLTVDALGQGEIYREEINL